MEAIGTQDFWKSSYDFGKELPNLPVDAKEVYGLLVQIDELHPDGAAHEFYSGLQKWVANYPEQGLELNKYLITDNGSLLSKYHLHISVGLSQTSLRKQILLNLTDLIDSSDSNKQNIGLRSASMLNYDESESEISFLEALQNRITEIIDSEKVDQLSFAIDTCGRLYKKLPNAVLILKKASNFNYQESQLAIADCLWIFIKYDDDVVLYKRLLSNLIESKPQSTVIVQRLTTIFSQTLQIDSLFTVEYIEKWLISRPDWKDIEPFKHLFLEIYSKEKKVFQALITNWLNSNDNKLHKAVAAILGNFYTSSIRDIELDSDTLSTLSNMDIMYIANKIVGHVIVKEHLQSMMFSILHAKPKDTEVASFISDIFREYIIYNYPSVKEFLQNKKSKETAFNKKIINEIVNSSEQYFKNLENLPRLKELFPSEKRMELYYRQKHKIQNDLMKGSQDRSFLQSFFKKVVLKRGKTFFMKTDSGYSDKTSLGHVEASIELPRGEYIDPVGQIKIRHHCLNDQRK